MNNLNWLELTKRVYFVLWGLLIAAMCFWVFNIVFLSNNPEAFLAGVGIISASVIGPWFALKISRWVYAGLNEKKSS